MNKVILVGRLTKDPELKTTATGVNCTNITIAVPRRFKRDEADFINCTAWRQTAEFICNWFSKGSNIAVSGSLQVRTWEDQNQEKRYATEVNVEEAEFAGSKNDGQATAADNYNESFTPYNNADLPSFDEIDEDLPF